MADNYPYHVNTAQVKKFLEHIPTAGVPDKITFKYLESVGFTSSNDRSIITILKFIGFISSSGVPTDIWRAYRNKARSKKILAAALVKSYSTLFTTYPDAQRKDNEALRNFFSGHTSVSEGTISYMVRTFKTMADMGDFSGTLPEVDTDSGDEEEQRAIAVKRRVTTGASEMTVNINIQLQIPATDKAETYDNFFAAMKKHLLS